MRGNPRRSRIAVLVAAVASASAVAAACALLVVGEARVNSIPGLAVAVFGTFLTSMAIIAAFSIKEGSRWPTPWEALDRAHVPAWFVVALGSVVTALLAGAIDSSFLSAFSLTLALAAVPLGTWGLWGLISLSSDQGRWGLVVELLAKSILETGKADRARHPDLGEIDTEDHVPDSFLTAGAPRRPRRTGVSIEQVPGVLREYADRRDPEAIVGLVDEVHAGACLALERGASLDFDAYLNSVDTLLYVQRRTFGELASRVLSGQLGDATARIALTRAGEAIVDVAGRAQRLDAAPGRDPRRVEVVVARHLTALCRLAGSVMQEADAQLRQRARSAGLDLAGGTERAGALALRTACSDLLQAVRWAVAPDPPGMKIPPDHVWRSGLSDPESALVWLWSTAESTSGPFGVGLYAVCEILTRKKFPESYWDGFDVFTEIERRLGADAPAASREAVERAGGLARLSLELGAMRLAATPPRSRGTPTFDRDPAQRDDRHVACNLFLAAAGFKPPGRDPVADFAWLLADRPRGSLWAVVYDQLAQLPDRVLPPPLQPLHRHPEACLLAICLPLTPLDEEIRAGGFDDVKAFIAQLPGPLLERTAALAVSLTAVEEVELGNSRGEHEHELIEAARFARKVAPGQLPPQAIGVPTEPTSPPGRDLPDELLGTSFDGAIQRLADADSELEVDLIQRDRRWLDDWGDAREELDVALLAAVLRGTARVRRIVLYDLPRDTDRHATRLHYRWVGSLATAVRCCQDGAGGRPGYEVRRLIVPDAESQPAIPRDRIAIRAPGEMSDPDSGQFDALWARLHQERDAQGSDGLGLIEL